jgi:hypothetical protein
MKYWKSSRNIGRGKTKKKQLSLVVQNNMEPEFFKHNKVQLHTTPFNTLKTCLQSRSLKGLTCSQITLNLNFG